MTSQAYRDNYRLIEWKPVRYERRRVIPPARSDLPCPHIVGDTMDPVQSMATGKMYDSKSAIRAEYKQLGLTEVGNDSSVIDPKPFRKPKPDRKAIRSTIERAFSRAGFPA